MKVGVCAPNLHYSQEDWNRYRIAGFPAVKIMWYHTDEEIIHQRKLGATYIMGRLWDSVDPNQGDRYRGDKEWEDLCVATINRMYALGIVDFQFDCECNLTWKLKDAKLWSWLVDRVVRRVRDRIPKDVRLGLTPLAWTPDTWKSAEAVWIPEQMKVVDLFDFICIDSYWQAAEHYNVPSYGGNVTEWHDRLMRGVDKPYSVVELGGSFYKTPGITRPQIDRAMELQYPQWLRWAPGRTGWGPGKTGYLESVFWYILGGTQHWQGYWMSDRTLRAIAKQTPAA